MQHLYNIIIVYLFLHHVIFELYTEYHLEIKIKINIYKYKMNSNPEDECLIHDHI